MKTHKLIKKQTINRNINDTFSFFEKPENLSLITPKKLNFQIITPSPIVMKKEAIIDYTINLLGIKLYWKTEITDYNPPFSFTDMQLKGPYSKWIHTHTFIDNGNKTNMIDEVEYSIPLCVFGELAHIIYVKNELKNIFDHREKVISEYLNQEAK